MFKVVAFLQNPWFKDPEDMFMGRLAGKRLRAVFDKWCDEIVWEEISPKIGGHSASQVSADLSHMQSVVNEHNPDVILAFGKIAEEAAARLNPRPTTICGPHPAARHGAMHNLYWMRRKLEEIARMRHVD